MRIAIDPVPIVVGMYAHAGELVSRATRRREEEGAESLGKRFSRQREAADREVQRMVRTLQSDVKTVDKLLKKTADVWKISRETDLVELVVQPRGESADPSAYVLLQPPEIRALLLAIRDAARGAGEDERILEELERAAAEMEGRPKEYLAFGFDPWNG